MSDIILFMNTNLKLVASKGKPDPKDNQALINGMLSYHLAKEHPRKKESFSIFLKNQNKVLGGVIVAFEWTGMEIQSLWVDESIRSQDWGSKLMEAAEKEAIKRGFNLAFTNTFSWQAPAFY